MRVLRCQIEKIIIYWHFHNCSNLFNIVENIFISLTCLAITIERPKMEARKIRCVLLYQNVCLGACDNPETRKLMMVLSVSANNDFCYHVEGTWLTFCSRSWKQMFEEITFLKFWRNYCRLMMCFSMMITTIPTK